MCKMLSNRKRAVHYTRRDYRRCSWLYHLNRSALSVEGTDTSNGAMLWVPLREAMDLHRSLSLDRGKQKTIRKPSQLMGGFSPSGQGSLGSYTATDGWA